MSKASAYEELKNLGCPVFPFTDHENIFTISTEQPNSSEWLNYHSVKMIDINPKLRRVLDKHNLGAGWVNEAVLGIYLND